MIIPSDSYEMMSVFYLYSTFLRGFYAVSHEYCEYK